MHRAPRQLALLALALLAACAEPAGEAEHDHQHELGGRPFVPPELAGRGRPVFSFVNGDFETGDTGSWTVSLYRNNGLGAASPTSRAQLNLAAPTAAITNRTSVKTAPTESLLATGVAADATLYIPKYHTHAVVVNELGNNRNVNAIKQQMVVTNEDVDPNDGKVHIRFALAAVLENPGHTAVQQPYFFTQLTNVTRGNAVLFYTFNYSNQPGVPWKSTTDPADGDPVLYTDWQSMDIAPGPTQLAVGDTVELEIIAAGCSLGGHYGQVYLDGIGAYLPGLGIAATAPASVNRGSTLTYTYRYSNNGIDAAPNTVVTAVLPTGTTFASLSAPGASCTAPAAGATGTVTCNVGTVNPATSSTFTVTVNVTAAATSPISHGNYTISATQVSPLIGPLVTTAVTSGVTYADLVTTASDGVAAVGWGATTVYSVTVRNAGPSAANGATVAVPVPANVSAFSSWTCAASGGATCAAPGGTGPISTTANLPSGGQVTYAITAAVAAGSGSGSISLQANAATPVGVTDSTPSNNAAVDYDEVGVLRTLTVTKAGTGAGTVLSSPAAIACGVGCASQAASFLDGASVVLTASTAAGQRFLSWTAGPCAGSASPTCTVPLAADATVTADFMAGDWLVSGSAPGGNGAVTCQSPRLDGQSATCTIAPAPRFRLTALTDEGVDVLAAVAGGAYTIASVPGDHAVVATFSPNTAATSLAAAPATSAALGAPVTFTATVGGVAPAGTPGGTVDFLAGATPLCTAAPVSGGQATCVTSALAVGTHLVTAASSGDATWPGATSPALSFDVTAGTATLTVSAGAGPHTYGQPVTLVATAAGPAGHATPTGTVTFRIDGVAIPGCTDVPVVAGEATCVTSALPAGSPAVTVDYGGDGSYLPASGAGGVSIPVAQATAVVTLSGLAQVYDGAPGPVTVTTSPGGLAVVVTYDGSTTPPTAPGSYAVIATVADPNFQGSATGTLVIAKADATVALSSLAQTYTGAPLGAAATTVPPGLTVTFTYDGSPTPPTAAGSYAVVATVSDPLYQGTAAGTLVIGKATAAVTLGGLAQTYTGAPRVATATTAPAGLTVTFEYDGAPTPPTDAGTYAVVGTVSDPNWQGSAAGTLVVGKGTASLTLGSLAQVYTGAPRAATATTVPAGLTATFTYDGSPAPPTGAGTYAVVGTIVDPNWQGTASGTLAVGKAAAAVTLADLTRTFTGGPLAPSATTVPPGLAVTFTFDGSATPPTAPGSYAVIANVEDANWQGTASGTFTVEKAPATITLSGLSQPYTGGPITPSAATSPAGLTVTFTYGGSPTPPTAPGTYVVVATIQDGSFQGSVTSTLVITQADATVTLAGLDQTYDGAPKAATATTVPAGLAVTITYDGAPTPPTGAGSYAVVATVSDPLYQGTASGTLVVGKGTATVTLAALSQAYTGTPRTASVGTVPGGLGVTLTYDGAPTAPTLVGSYAVVATVQDPNWQGTAAGTLEITKATAGVTLGNLSQTFNGTPRVAIASTTPAGLSVTFTYDGSPAAPTAAGSYAVVATVQDANWQGSAAGTLTVGKATATVTLGDLAHVYDGAPHPATATTEPPGLTVAFTYAGAATPPTGVGSVAVLATVVDADYQGTGSGTLTISRGAATVALGTSPSPSIWQQPVTLTATVSGPGVVPRGSVTFSDGATTLCGGPVLLSGAGVATCPTIGLEVGAHTLSAAYSGDATYLPASGDAAHQVDAAATSTALAASTFAPVYGQAVTLTATVAVLAPGGGTPAGTVSFTEGATTWCTSPVAGATATCLLPAALATGAHTFTATYGGSTQHLASSSAGLTRTVSQGASSAVIVTSGSPAAYGAPVTFTATISGPAGSPTGSVAFTAGPLSLCPSVPLDAGVARCTSSTIPPGAYLVAASYGGDANHTGAFASVPQAIDAAAPVVTVSAAPSPATFGDVVTLTATVTGPGAVPSGTVAFLEAGATLCSATLDAGGVASCASSPLAVGDHAIGADYHGDANFTPASGAASLTVVPAPVTVALGSSANPAAYASGPVFTATVAGPGGVPGGSVTFRDGADVLCGGPVPLAGGQATCRPLGAASLGGGSHALTASYGGAASYLPGTSPTLTQVIERAAPTLTLATSGTPTVYGVAVTFTATLGGAGVVPGGSVSFTDGPTTLCDAVPVVGGVARCTTAALLRGAHTITATSTGDANYLGASASRVQVVTEATPTTTLATSPAPSVFGEEVLLTVGVSGVPGGVAPGGTVTIREGATELCGGPLPLVGGEATCRKADFPAGDHLLVVSYGGDANYLPGPPAGTLHTVRRAPTAVALEAAPAAPVHGEPLVLTATVTVPPPGLGLPSGPVDFYDGATVIGTAELDPATGVATLTLGAAEALPAGPHDLSATYAGDHDFEGALSPTIPAFLVGQASTLVAVSADVPTSAWGQPVTFTVTVDAVAPGGGTPGGTVRITVDGDAPRDLPLTAGVATFVDATLEVGSHAVEATYLGDPDFLPSSGAHAQAVTLSAVEVAVAATPSPSVYGQPVSFDVAVAAAPPGAGAPGGTVRLLSGATVVASGALDASGAVRLTFARLPVGTAALTVSYEGDAHFTPGGRALDHLVMPAATEVTLVASTALTVYGAPVTFRAAVTPAFFGVGAPTGTVTFSEGGALLAEVPLDAAGRADFTAAALSPGLHLVEAAYAGDGAFLDGVSLPAAVTVGAASLSLGLAVTPNPSVAGEHVGWTVQAVAQAPSLAVPAGTVEISDGGAVLETLTLDAGGRATGGTAALAVGLHALRARFLDDARFTALNAPTTTQQVVRAATGVALSAAPSPSVFGAPVTFTARVAPQAPGAGTPTGTVTFSEGGLELGAAPVDAAGEARFTATGLATGAHEVVASYAGDASFEPAASPAWTQVVSRAGTAATTEASPSAAVYGQPISLSVTVTSSSGVPTGTVELRVDGAPFGTATLDAAGRASLVTGALLPGAHLVVASYPGDADHLPTTAPAAAVSVQPAATTTTLSADPVAAVAGQPVTLTAEVLPVAPGAGVPTGAVTFRDGAVELGTSAVNPATGRATLVVPALAVGDHALAAAYPGDGRFLASATAAPLALPVSRAAVAVAITADPAAPVNGQPVTLTVQVSAAAPGGGTPTGQVTLSDGGRTLGAVELSGGRGSLVAALPAGPRALEATFPGDGAFEPGTGSAALTVGRALTTTALATSGSPSPFGQPVTLTATVQVVAPGAGEPSGAVTFKDGAAVLGTAALAAGGRATFTAVLPEGPHALTAEYGGDPGFAPSAGAAQQQVTTSPVTIEVTPGPNPASFGEPVTVAISVSGAGQGTPGGTVTILDGAVVVATATLDASGQASVLLTDLPVGLHQLTVTYGGGGGFAAGSTSVSLTVDAADVQLSLASSRNPSRAGRPVTLTATATSGHATPTGTVTFKDGQTIIGTASLVDGVATLTTRALAKGTHPITAQLAASAGFGAASGAVPGGQVVENSAPVAGSGQALRLGAGHALGASAPAAEALDDAATVELWARAAWSAPGEAGEAPTLVRLGGAAGTRWALGVTPARTGLTVTLGATTTTVAGDLSDGAWHQLSLVAADGAVTVRLDGREVAAIAGGPGAAAGEALEVGQGFVGEVDELRLWATARPAEALAAAARRPLRGDEPGLLGCWRMDEGDGVELFDAGPAAVDLVAALDPAVPSAGAFGPSDAWRHRTAPRERPAAPIDAGYDADGDRLTLAITTPPAHGTATPDGVALQVGYLGATGYSGDDELAFRLTDDEGATGDFAVHLTVERILACQADADCSGGDVCAQHVCVDPAALAARSGGCGCTSGAGGAVALWSLLGLGLALRRPRRAGRREGGRP